METSRSGRAPAHSRAHESNGSEVETSPWYAPYVVWWLLVTLVALSVVDAWSSWILLRSNGIESNPFARYLVAHVGITGAALVRVLLGCSIAWCLARCIQLRPVQSTLVIVGVSVLGITAWWGLACINNLQWLAKT